MLRPGPEGTLLVPDRAYARAWTLRTGGTDQSYVDLDDPTRIEFDYIQRFADVIEARWPAVQRPGPLGAATDALASDRGARAPLRVVHVGGAAMTLPRYLVSTRPRSSQLVLEPDAELTAFVREHLPLPARSGVRVRPEDGRTGLATLRDDYADLVVVDAFVGAQVPADLATIEWWTECRRALTGEGVLLVNLTDRGPLAYSRRALAGVTVTFAHVMLGTEPSTLKGRRFGNLVAAASAAPLPVEAVAARMGLPPYPYRVVHGARLNQLLGGAAPFTDADSALSPPPPRGLAGLLGS